MMKTIALLLLVVVALLAALGNLFFKKAALLPRKNLWRKMFSGYFILGAALFLVCPVISAFCARYTEFAVMYAMTALNFVFILLLSRCFLAEKIDRCKISGVCLIIAGIVLMVLA